MFEPHFGLRENPFSTSHDPRFVYPSPEHLEAVAHFRYGVQNREAFVLVTGEVGTGKTTAVRDLVGRLEQQAHVALLQNTALSRQELLEELCRRFSVPWEENLSKPALLGRLESALGERFDRGETCIVIIDEAQDLSNDLLEEIRLLSNLEWRGGHLLHICLAGQPELEERLATPGLRPLRQRISVKYRIQPLAAEETERYIHHRLRVAGGDGPRVFPTDTAAAVHEVTHGIPREINIVAAQALLNAYVDGALAVSPRHVRQVVDEFGFQSVLSRPEARTAPPSPQPAPAAPAPVAPPTPSAPSVQPAPVASVSSRPAVAPTPQPATPPAPAPQPPPVPAATPAIPVPVTPVRAPAAPARTVSNWRDQPPAPVPLAPQPMPGLEPTPMSGRAAPREHRPWPWPRIPLWVPIVGLALLAVIALLAGGVIGRMWRAAATSAVVEEQGAIPTRAEETPPAPAPRRAERRAPSAATGTTSGSGGFAIQVASYRTESRARVALAGLRIATGLAGQVVAATVPNGSWYRVVLGSFATREEAASKSEDLLGRGIVPADRIVVRAATRPAESATPP